MLYFRKVEEIYPVWATQLSETLLCCSVTPPCVLTWLRLENEYNYFSKIDVMVGLRNSFLTCWREAPPPRKTWCVSLRTH